MKALSRIIIVVLLFAVLIAMVWITRPETSVRLDTAALPNLQVFELKRAAIHPRQLLVGTLEPARTAQMYFEVPGRVIARAVEPGQSVSEGTVFLSLEDGDFQDKRDSAQAAVAREKAGIGRDKTLISLAHQTAGLAKRDYGRLDQLSKKDLASASLREQAMQRLIQLKLEEARLQYSLDTAESRLVERRSSLDQAQRNLQRTSLRAPFSGLVNRVLLDIGDRADTLKLAVEIIDTSSLMLVVDVGTDIAVELHLGQPVSVSIGEVTVRGYIFALQQAPDPRTYTHALKIQIKNNGLMPGMLASVDLPLQPHLDVLQVPVAALLADEGQYFVFRVVAGQLQKIPVKTGLRYQGLVEVAGDLKTGDSLVARDVVMLSDGLQVKVKVPAAVTANN